MSVERDRVPLERLRALNPIPAGQFDDLVWTQPVHALFEQIIAVEQLASFWSRGAQTRLPARRSGRWRAPRAALLAGLASLLVAVAGYALVGRQPSKPHTVACFASADLLATTVVVGVDDGGPVAACAAAWGRGDLGGRSSPTLKACVLESGVVGVFPEALGRDVCLDLGLASASSPAAEPPRASVIAPPTSVGGSVSVAVVEPERFAGFRDAVVRRVAAEGCIGAGPAEAVVREELDRAGLAGWTVTVGVGEDGRGFSAELPCASLSFQPEQRTVELVPLPRPG